MLILKFMVFNEKKLVKLKLIFIVFFYPVIFTMLLYTHLHFNRTLSSRRNMAL